MYSISRRHSGRFTSCRRARSEGAWWSCYRQRSVARVGGRTPVGWYIDRRQRCTVEWFRGECSGETHGVARSGD